MSPDFFETAILWCDPALSVEKKKQITSWIFKTYITQYMTAISIFTQDSASTHNLNQEERKTERFWRSFAHKAQSRQLSQKTSADSEQTKQQAADRQPAGAPEKILSTLHCAPNTTIGFLVEHIILSLKLHSSRHNSAKSEWKNNC